MQRQTPYKGDKKAIKSNGLNANNLALVCLRIDLNTETPELPEVIASTQLTSRANLLRQKLTRTGARIQLVWTKACPASQQYKHPKCYAKIPYFITYCMWFNLDYQLCRRCRYYT